MAYGVTSSTLLIAAGVAPAAASAAVHFSEIGTSLVSGASHHKLGNVDWRTVSILAVPGFVGAFLGATALSNLDAAIAKPIVATILLGLGVYVVYRFLRLGGRRPTFKAPALGGFLAPMGLVAGTLDAVGGGGWGPVGTTSLLSSGRLEPRKVVGSIDTSEFVVAVGGSLGFLLGLGSQGINWGYAGALLAGGVIAAPIAAWLVKPPRGPRARRRRRWPDHAHQHQDAPGGRRRHRRRGGPGRRGRSSSSGSPASSGRSSRSAWPGRSPTSAPLEPRAGLTRRRTPAGTSGAPAGPWSVSADMSDKLLPCASPPKPTTPSGR